MMRSGGAGVNEDMYQQQAQRQLPIPNARFWSYIYRVALPDRTIERRTSFRKVKPCLRDGQRILLEPQLTRNSAASQD